MAKRKKVMLADVLWRAANEYLSEALSHWDEGRWLSEYSCCAVFECMDSGRSGLGWGGKDGAASFLQRLGCPIGSAAQRFRTSDLRERQQRRYMWLLLAMHVAEDEAIEIEATA